jgi:hypothetical protein
VEGVTSGERLLRRMLLREHVLCRGACPCWEESVPDITGKTRAGPARGSPEQEPPQVFAPRHRNNDLRSSLYVKEDLFVSFVKILCSTHLRSLLAIEYFVFV